MRSSDFQPLRHGDAPEGRGGFRPLRAPGTAGEAPEAPAEPETPEERPDVRAAFDAGYEQGRREAYAEVEEAGRTLGRALEALADFRTALRDRYERELLELALGVARKVVQQELQERPAIWLGMIRAAIRRIVDREQVVVRVPPALARFLREADAELRAALEGVKDVQIVEDPGLPAAGCVLESRFGEVDLGLETQLAAAERALVQIDE